MGSEYSWVVDAFIVVLVVVSAYLAMVRGFFREIFALASWVIAFFAAFFLAAPLMPVLTGIPGLGKLLQNCDIGLLVAFVLVFGAALIIAGVIIWMFSSQGGNAAVGVIDQVLGLVYGAFRGLVLVAVLLIAYQEIMKSEADEWEIVESAVVYPYVEQAADMIRSVTPEDMPGWFESQLDGMRAECLAAQGGGTGA